MVRVPFRMAVAAWTLAAVIAACVAPAVTFAMGVAPGASADHACCPQAISENAPTGRSTGTPPPCCAVGGSSPQAPANAPAPVRSVTANLVASGPAPSWHQAALRSAGATPRPSFAFGPIPLVIRTSVLLI